MSQNRNIAGIRREYGELSLSEDSLPKEPLVLFKKWFDEVVQNETADPTAMVLSTVDEEGCPDSRVVLLKGLEEGNFLFYTNYSSVKAQQIEKCSRVALNFYWPLMARQVRIRGRISKVSEAKSDSYFSSRPFASQVSALASLQSQEIADRCILEQKFNELLSQFDKKIVQRPISWGGYEVVPDEIEFWQGRDNRLHDRIQYYKKENAWYFRRLAP